MTFQLSQLFKEWEAKAAKQKEKYKEAMEQYTASGGASGGGGGSSGASKKKPSKSKSSGNLSVSPSKITSKEYISDDDSSSDDDKPVSAFHISQLFNFSFFKIFLKKVFFLKKNFCVLF